MGTWNSSPSWVAFQADLHKQCKSRSTDLELLVEMKVTAILENIMAIQLNLYIDIIFNS